MMNLTRERIRQLEISGLHKIKEVQENKKRLQDYTDLELIDDEILKGN